MMLLAIFTLSLILIFILIKYSEKIGLIDIPNDRSMHKKLVPRGAGIGFTLAALIGLLIFEFSHFIEYYYIYLAIFIVFIVGVLDDFKGTSPKTKFIFIFVATSILYLFDIQINTLGNYLGMEITIPSWLVLPFSFFAIAGFTNAVNLIDGLDGLAGIMSVIMMSTFLAIGITNDDMILITLSLPFIASILAFLYYNWNPAKIFMGDSGSLTLGFVIAILAIQSLHYVSPAAVIFIVALPILDTFIVMTRRIQRKTSPFKPDKNHMHHFLYKTKVDVKFTVILLSSMQLAFSIIGYQFKEVNNLLTLLLFVLLYFIFLNLFDFRLRRRKKIKKDREQLSKKLFKIKK